MSRKALLLFLATGLAWGLPYFFIQIALEDFSSYSIIFIRVLIGAAIMVPLALNSGALKIALKHWKWVLFFAVMEMIIPWWLITEAVDIFLLASQLCLLQQFRCLELLLPVF